MFDFRSTFCSRTDLAVDVIVPEFYVYAVRNGEGTVDSRGRSITTVINPEARLAAFNYR